MRKWYLLKKVNNNTPVVVFSDLNLVDANGDNLGITKWVEEAIEAEKAADFYYLLACPAITGCTMMINKKLERVCCRTNHH